MIVAFFTLLNTDSTNMANKFTNLLPYHIKTLINNLLNQLLIKSTGLTSRIYACNNHNLMYKKHN